MNSNLQYCVISDMRINCVDIICNTLQLLYICNVMFCDVGYLLSLAGEREKECLGERLPRDAGELTTLR